MTDVYQRLAEHLDNLPAGYPATETGVELRILKRLFTSEEAEIATGLGMLPEPCAAIAARLGREAQTLAPALEAMSRKGLIFRNSKNGQHTYMAAQFVVGIWEYHVNDLDEDLIRDVNAYIPYLMKKGWTDRKTKQLRVIPVAQSVSAEMSVTPYEAAEAIVRQQSKIVVAPCICRREHAMVGQGCDKPLEACLTFGSGAYYYEQNGLGREITQEEALSLLKRGEEAGLVLQPSNSQKPINICMCCGCCCQVLKNMRTLDRPALAVHTNYYAEVNAEDCTGCESCVARCQMDAIAVDDVAVVDFDRCIGCGLCITDCPTDAMLLKHKDAGDRYVPPGNTVETYIKMATERGKI
ncbi:MAG: 4Fe-4S binding protein [Desulfobacterales bacterium]|nr:4Fe-4S binding protein [Desulfobacterales bacterium]